jgi:membrane protein required for colicin V production
LSNLSVNFVDLAVLGVLLISALIAFSRGLLREVLTIGAWVGAVLAAIWGFPYLKAIARKYIAMQVVADALTVTVIFMVTLIICAGISHMLARNVRSSAFGSLDRSLGLLFGLIRGAVLVCFAYLLFTWAVPNAADQPEAIKSAHSLPLVAGGANILRALLPKSALDKGAAAAADARRQVEEQFSEEVMPKIGQPATKPAASKTDPGYNANERKDLDRLIRGNQ